MATITTRTDFKAKCLRRLGDGAIQINVTDDQIEDCVDDALKMFYDYHYDGTQLMYYKHQVTDTDKVNKYIDMPEDVIGAVDLFSIGDPVAMNDNFFNIRYQIALNDLYNLTTVSMVPYYMTMQHLTLIQELLVGKQPLRYNRNVNKLYIDMDWNTINTGAFLLVQVYQIVDPETYPDTWNDRWLQLYTTCLIQQQWGRNTSKFQGVQLPGGVVVNGESLLQRADQWKRELEDELKNSYAAPILDMIG